MLARCREELVCDLAETYHLFDPFALPEDLFNEANGKVSEDAVYTAVFMEVPLPCCDEE